jgi:hypothetical protein
MNHAKPHDRPLTLCEIIDFDEALLAACGPEERADLLTEARVLAHAFTEGGAAEELEEMAATLSAGRRDAEMGRARARKLAAALKHLATHPWDDES